TDLLNFCVWRSPSFQLRNQARVGKAGGRLAVLRLPDADRAARLEAGQAVGAADIVALRLQRLLERCDVRAVEIADRPPGAGEGGVTLGDAVGGVADEQRIEVA